MRTVKNSKVWGIDMFLGVGGLFDGITTTHWGNGYGAWEQAAAQQAAMARQVEYLQIDKRRDLGAAIREYDKCKRAKYWHDWHIWASHADGFYV